MLATAGILQAAETKFEYDASIGEVYSQDVFRTGTDPINDYITGLRLNAGLNFKTPRSDTQFKYSPEYLWYAHISDLTHLDQRFRASWEMQASPRSKVDFRQGYSNTTRQSGFQDLTGTGGNVSEPIITLATRTAWDLEPHYELQSSPAHDWEFEALYRSESYDQPNLIDSEQFGVWGGFDHQLGRKQKLGWRLRGDSYRFASDAGTITNVYDRFAQTEIRWSWATTDRVSVSANGGFFQANGTGLDTATGPTGGLSGQWRWRHTTLDAGYDIGYSTGGGISTTDFSQAGNLTLAGHWGDGYEVSGTAGYISRASVDSRGQSTPNLHGRSLRAELSKSWRQGLKCTAAIQAIRQDELSGRSLSYGEAVLGLTYTPVKRELVHLPPVEPTEPAELPPDSQHGQDGP